MESCCEEKVGGCRGADNNNNHLYAKIYDDGLTLVLRHGKPRCMANHSEGIIANRLFAFNCKAGCLIKSGCLFNGLRIESMITGTVIVLKCQIFTIKIKTGFLLVMI